MNKNMSIKELAGIVGQAFENNGIDAVLVGGSCVTIYTENKYQSYDLDYITYETEKNASKVLKKLGFKYDSHKYYIHSECPFFIEFLAPPIAIGNEPIKKLKTLKIKTGMIKLLTPTDCVKDRLAAYFYWNDRQCLDQAVMVSESQDINLENIKNWAKNENQLEKLGHFLMRIKKNS